MRTGIALAILVHLLTASGILCSLLAMRAVILGVDLVTAFLWLGVALVIDAVDGPLARLVDAKGQLPRFSGERLDLIIDYVNYVFLPALIVIEGNIVVGWAGVLAAGLILMTSLYHFSDLASKTRDNYFVGFPAVWNLVVFYLLAFQASSGVSMLMIGVLSLATFAPLKWIHPLRVKRLWPLTLVVVVAWSAAAIATLVAGFAPGMIAQMVLIAGLVYIVAISLLRSVHRPAMP